jgi:protein-arginine kinase activator protein McsA
VVGTLFQPTDASGIIDLVYEKLGKAREVQQTYKSLIEKGRPEDAQKYLDENIESLMLTTMAGQFTKHMGEITEYERSIRSSNMTPEEKRAALDEARQAKIELAKAVRDQLGKTTRQAVPA